MAVTLNGKTATVVPSKAPDTIKRMADAASSFLASLGKAELAKATFPFAGDERYDWHYTPVDRNGLLISEMTPNQTKLAFEMMETGYNASGYAMARQIIRLETILGEYEAMTNSASQWHRLEERYWFSVFGEPGSEKPWGWRVGGHHIGIVASVVGNTEVSIHPLFFGSNPAEVKHGEHKGMRTLAEEEDWARALVSGMTDSQKVDRYSRPRRTRRHPHHNRPRRRPWHHTARHLDRRPLRRPARIGNQTHPTLRVPCCGRDGNQLLESARTRELGQHPLRVGRTVGTLPGPLLQHPPRPLRHRVRQHPKRRQPHPLRPPRLHSRLRRGPASGALPRGALMH